MQKIFSSDQVRKADAYTIKNEPVSSIDLMERAAGSCVEWMNKSQDLSSKNVIIFCGPGNNGGDGLAIARLLHEKQVHVSAFIPDESSKLSEDFAINLHRAKESGVNLQFFEAFDFKQATENFVLIDALFGSGLSKPLEDNYKELVDILNKNKCITISIDIPSGLYADKPIDMDKDSVIKSDYTLCFQFPKLAFLFPENEFFAGSKSRSSG